jgi:hypothetical protein
MVPATYGGFLEDLVHDLGSGRGQLRLVVQPIVAMVLGARLGLSDAREGAAPFVWRLATGAHERRELLKRSLSDVLIPFCIAVIVDSILQHYTLGYVRPGGAFVVGLLLVWLPYAVARALANRIARRAHHAHA